MAALCAITTMLCFGCASHRNAANSYGYAPPMAPPVAGGERPAAGRRRRRRPADGRGHAGLSAGDRSGAAGHDRRPDNPAVPL